MFFFSNIWSGLQYAQTNLPNISKQSEFQGPKKLEEIILFSPIFSSVLQFVMWQPCVGLPHHTNRTNYEKKISPNYLDTELKFGLL